MMDSNQDEWLLMIAHLVPSDLSKFNESKYSFGSKNTISINLKVIDN